MSNRRSHQKSFQSAYYRNKAVGNCGMKKFKRLYFNIHKACIIEVSANATCRKGVFVGAIACPPFEEGNVFLEKDLRI